MTRRSGVALLLLGALLVVSRALVWTAHAPNFDYANFALGVVRFAPADHQPHPPGYPGVILVAKALAGLTPVRALQVTALAGSLAALLGAYLLGRRLGGEAGGLWAAGLLTLQPVFWYSGVTSPTRVYLAAGVCWLLYLLGELAAGRDRLLWIAAVSLAVAGGFRPELPVLFAAPFVLAARRGGHRWRSIGAAALVGMAAGLPWVLWLGASFGSLSQLVYIYYHYFLHHTSNTSALLGAPAAAWQSLIRGTLLWNGPPAALVLVAWLLGGRLAPAAGFGRLAGMYLAPALTIQLVFHLAPDAPDHTLGTVATFTVLAGALAGAARLVWLPAAGVTALLGVSLAAPGTLSPDLDILSVRSFAAAQRPVAEMVGELRASVRAGDAIVVLNDSPVAARVLGPEFPQTQILLLDPGGGARLYRWRQTELPEGNIPLPGVRRLHVLTAHLGSAEPWCAGAKCEASAGRVVVEPGSRPVELSVAGYRVFMTN